MWPFAESLLWSAFFHRHTFASRMLDVSPTTNVLRVLFKNFHNPLKRPLCVAFATSTPSCSVHITSAFTYTTKAIRCRQDTLPVGCRHLLTLLPVHRPKRWNVSPYVCVGNKSLLFETTYAGRQKSAADSLLHIQCQFPRANGLTNDVVDLPKYEEPETT